MSIYLPLTFLFYHLSAFSQPQYGREDIVITTISEDDGEIHLIEFNDLVKLLPQYVDMEIQLQVDSSSGDTMNLKTTTSRTGATDLRTTIADFRSSTFPTETHTGSFLQAPSWEHNDESSLEIEPQIIEEKENSSSAQITNSTELSERRSYSIKNNPTLSEVTEEASDSGDPRVITILDIINSQEPDEEGRKCVNKTMLRRETEYEEIVRCDHHYNERCFTTFITSHVPQQIEECEERFRIVCDISFEHKAVTEMVEECTTPLVPDCDGDNVPEVCRTVYDTVCDTKQVGSEVEEQFPNCTTVTMEKDGEVRPVQQCSVETRTVTHSNPRTECRKEPKELCAPGDCPLIEVNTM